MKLRPYQELAADFIYEHDRAMVLAPVGAGKTAITLTGMWEMLRDQHVKRFLVLAPKRVCTDVWPIEQPKWAPFMSLTVAVGTPKQRLAALKSKAQVVVTNYDNIQWLAEQALNFDGIVFDELTRLKNPSGTRFKSLLKVMEPMRVRWGLTGSFTSNGLEDVFGQCKIVNQDLLGRSKGAFMQQYFVLMNPEFGEWVPRPNALDKVMQKIKPATYVLEPGEYKDKLPPCHHVEVMCKMDLTPYNKLKKEFVLDTNSEASDVPGKFTVTQTPVWFSSHKFDRLEELLEENQHANTIIAYTYKEELAELKRRLRVTTLDDDDAIARWNRGEVRILAVHPKSAGHGLNLQHGGQHMVFLSLPWSLELFEQTVGRLHRSGQKHDVWVYVLMTEKTVDEKIWAALHTKQAVSEIALEALK